MDERLVLVELIASQCSKRPEQMEKLLELYRRTANRIDEMARKEAAARFDREVVGHTYGDLLGQLLEKMRAAAEMQQEEPPRCEDAANCEEPQESAEIPQESAPKDPPGFITGKGATEKMQVLSRLDRVRAQGVSVQAIADAAEMKTGDVLNFIQRYPMKMEMYRRLDAALAKLEQ